MSIETESSAPHVSDDPKPEIRLGMIAVVAFFGIFLGWAAFAPMDAAVVAPGVVVVSGSRQTIQHRDGGVIAHINVQEGQRVQRGDLLIELADEEVLAQEQSIASQLISATLRRAYLRAEAAGSRQFERPTEFAQLPEEYRAQAETEYQRYARGGDARIAGYNAELGNLSRQEVLMRDELAGIRELANEQLAPLTRVRALERGVAELGGRRAELQAQRAAEMRQLDARAAELSSGLVAAHQMLERSRLRAPNSGVVVGLTAHTVGGVLRPGDRAMDIVPDDQALVVEAQVDPRDADDLRIGLDAEVKITAFSGRNLPIIHGAITRVSGDRFTDEHSGRAYFIARVESAPSELERLSASGGDRQLRAGLPAEIVVPTRKRTALQYLVEPLNQAFWRAFREP